MTLFSILAAIQFPILERIPLFGDAALSPHGLGIAIGFGLGALMMIKRAQKRGLGHVHEPNISESVQEMLTRSAFGAIVGARGFYVLTHLSDFQGRWHETFYAWQGGLTFLGGVAGAIGFAVPYARKKGWRMDMLLDSAAPGMALGLAVGRIGDLAIGDHIGAPTDFPLAWKCTTNFWVRASNSFGSVDPLPYPSGGAPTAGCFDVAVHHTALYDFGAALIVLLVLLAMERKRWFDGAFISAWVFIYGALRFTSDFARQDKTWFGLTGSQWALVAAAIAVAAWLVRTKPWGRSPWAWDLSFDHPWKSPDYNPETGRVTVAQSSHVAVTAAPEAEDGVGQLAVETGDTLTETSPEPAAPVEALASVVPAPEAADVSEPSAEDLPEPEAADVSEPSAEDDALGEDRPELPRERGGAPQLAVDLDEAPEASAEDAPVAPEPSPAVDPMSPPAPVEPPATHGDPPSEGLLDQRPNVIRSTSTQPKMATRPRGPKGPTSGT